MKYTVRIGGRTFAVEIGDLQARPIKATIDGETFEVWPEQTTDEATEKRMGADGTSTAARPAHPSQVLGAAAAAPAPTLSPASSSIDSVLAPIPGVIVSVAVQPGAEVAVGQELCVLEAMKMKSPIRAPRAGTIKAVRVSVGQQVKHREVLVDYAA
jgi:biotin carboxyl carrier protein